MNDSNVAITEQQTGNEVYFTFIVRVAIIVTPFWAKMQSTYHAASFQPA
jgi:hypothetical protein